MTVTIERAGPPPVAGATNSGVIEEDVPQNKGKLLDVQGLRALAVVLVVLNHLTGWPAGGFVGVDVFFVISGYVITNSLTHTTASRPSVGAYFGSFYVKRIRRLMPAALTTIVVGCATAYALFDTAEAHRVVVDGIWATLFSANWHFISVGTDYFAAAGPASPFEHYWSLSVEEQFYVVWPVLLFALLVRRRGGHSRPAVGSGRALAAVVGIVAVSLLWAWSQTTGSPVTAYFSTLTRAWELGVGAALALAIPLVRRMVPFPAVVSWTGLGVIVVSAFVIDADTPFPAPGAIAPVVGAALVIVAATARSTGVNPLLRGTRAVALGDASYAVYLVHLPVIVFLAALLPDATSYRVASSAVIIVGASWLLHVGVEKPLMSRGQRGPAARYRRVRPDAIVAGVGIVALGCSMVTLWPGDGEALAQKSRAVNAALVQAQVAQTATTSSGVGPYARDLQQSLRSALQQSSWPTLTPDVATEEGRQPVPNGLLSCGDIALRAAPECSFGDRNATRTAYLIGDSTSMAYAQAFRSVVSGIPGWRIRIAGAYGCSFDSVAFANADEADVTGCGKHNDDLVAEIGRVRPDVVFVTNTYTARQEAGTGKVLSDTEWIDALTSEVNRLPTTTAIVLVEPAPLGPATSECYDPATSPVSCVYRVPVAHKSRADAERALANSRGWTYVETQQWFCDAGTGYCPAFADGVPIKHDTVHVSYAYDDVLAPAMAEAFTAAKVFS